MPPTKDLFGSSYERKPTFEPIKENPDMKENLC